MSRHIQLSKATLGYPYRTIGKDLSLDIQQSEIISIIGPNGSGKSTLLKTLGRLLSPLEGVVYLDGKDMNSFSAKSLARSIAMLPQSAQAPGDMTVRDLVMCGRLPYRNAFSSLTTTDIAAVNQALVDTGLTKLSQQFLSTLSGGERQRAWLAMAIAQEPEVLLLDEPTTFLDVRYQLELMRLVKTLHERRHITVIMVLHDLNHAARFSQRLVAVKGGQIVADGPVTTVFTESVLSDLYEVKLVFTEIQVGTQRVLQCIPYESR